MQIQFNIDMHDMQTQLNINIHSITLHYSTITLQKSKLH